MTQAGRSAPRGASEERRRAAAVRILAHTLFRRGDARGEAPDLETALVLADERLVPDPGARRLVAAEARRLALAALAERGRGGRLEGRLATGLRVSLPEREGGARVVHIPLVIHHRDDTLSVVTLVPEGDDSEHRVRRHRRAARALFGRPVGALVVHPDGRIEAFPPGGPAGRTGGRRPTRSEPRGAASPDTGCSGSGRRPPARRRR